MRCGGGGGGGGHRRNPVRSKNDGKDRLVRRQGHATVLLSYVSGEDREEEREAPCTMVRRRRAEGGGAGVGTR